VLELLRAGQRRFAPLNEPVQLMTCCWCAAGPRTDGRKVAWKLELEPEFKLKDEALEARTCGLPRC